jgi:hypothetical protein
MINRERKKLQSVGLVAAAARVGQKTALGSWYKQFAVIETTAAILSRTCCSEECGGGDCFPQ